MDMGSLSKEYIRDYTKLEKGTLSPALIVP